MTNVEQSSPLRLFVSYSRADLGFADELYAGLEILGYAPTLDRHAIVEGDDWKARLGALIAEAETVVFIISPASARSEICAWEVEEAARLSKRIVPVLWRAPAPHAVPTRLSTLNYVRFDEGHAFTSGLRSIDRALKADLAWLRDMTRYLLRAQDWDRGGRAENRLLSGSDIGEMKRWVARRPPSGPELTPLHIEFLSASEAEEKKRSDAAQAQLDERERLLRDAEHAAGERAIALRKLSRRTTVGLIGTGALTVAAGGLAYWAQQAENRFQAERKRVAEAEARSFVETIRREAMRTDLEGQIVAYSASPGENAVGGDANDLPPYSRALLRELADENLSLAAALSRINKEIFQRASRLGFSQRPFLSSDLNGDIFFMRQPPTRKREAIVCTGGAQHPIPIQGNDLRGAKAWREFLQRTGATVHFIEEASRTCVMQSILKGQTSEATRNEFFVIIFLGMGGYVDGETYLMTSDTNLEFTRSDANSLDKAFEQFKATAIKLADVKHELRTRSAASGIILDIAQMDLREKFKIR